MNFLDKNPGKSLADIFEDITQFESNRIQIFEFDNWLKENYIELTPKERNLIVRYYDADKTGYLSLEEFT